MFYDVIISLFTNAHMMSWSSAARAKYARVDHAYLCELIREALMEDSVDLRPSRQTNGVHVVTVALD